MRPGFRFHLNPGYHIAGKPAPSHTRNPGPPPVHRSRRTVKIQYHRAPKTPVARVEATPKPGTAQPFTAAVHRSRTPPRYPRRVNPGFRFHLNPGYHIAGKP